MFDVFSAFCENKYVSLLMDIRGKLKGFLFFLSLSPSLPFPSETTKLLNIGIELIQIGLDNYRRDHHTVLMKECLEYNA